jgi:polar amino acid transport system permease protein
VTDAAGSLQLSEKEQWRRQYRKGQARRSTLVAVLSTLVVGVAAWLTVVNLPGWHDAHETFFNGGEFKRDFPDIARAMLLNLKILAVSEPCILAIALLVALCRTTTSPVLMPLRVGGSLFVDLFRGCPLYILLILFGIGIPALQLSWLTNSATIWGSIAIILSYGAYVAEVMRAGLQSVHPSQRAPARSLGLTQPQTLRLVVLPQGLRSVLPALLNDFVSLQKDVGLIAVVGGATDAILQAQYDNSLNFNFTPFVVAALLFIALAVPSGRLADAYARRATRRQQGGGVV